MKGFEITMKHSEESLLALAHMQYDLFCTRNFIARNILSTALLLTGAYFISRVWGIFLLVYGIYLMTSTYASSNRTARRIADQLEQAGQPLPASRYIFEKNKMRIVDLNSGEELDPVAYGDIFGLGEDREALYLFRSQYGGYRIPKEALGEREEAFRRFIQNKTGQLFIRRLTPLNRVRNWLHARETEPTHL